MAFNAIAWSDGWNFIVGPIARVLTSLVAGSFIDRMNKRKLMITTDIIRGFIVFVCRLWNLFGLSICCYF